MAHGFLCVLGDLCSSGDRRSVQCGHFTCSFKIEAHSRALAFWNFQGKSQILKCAKKGEICLSVQIPQELSIRALPLSVFLSDIVLIYVTVFLSSTTPRARGSMEDKVEMIAVFLPSCNTSCVCLSHSMILMNRPTSNPKWVSIVRLSHSMILMNRPTSNPKWVPSVFVCVCHTQWSWWIGPPLIQNESWFMIPDPEKSVHL